MTTLAGQRVPLVAIAFAVTLAMAINLLIPVDYLLPVLLVAGGGMLLVFYAVRGDLLFGLLIWFAALICFDLDFWRLIVPGFFNLTIPRILLVLLALVFGGMLIAGRFGLRVPARTTVLMTALLVYFTLSAVVTGFETIAVATVHYRLIGGYWFAVAAFFLMLHAVRNVGHLRWLCWFFFAVGLYLAWIGWCEHFEFWAGVYPRYIADPNRGIHWGRCRGPFLVSAMMGVALIFCFYSNLVLVRHVSPPKRWMIYAASLAILPVLFWTQTRSVWLGMILCSVLWLLQASRGKPRIVLAFVLAAMAVVGVATNWSNIASPERELGGVTAIEPIYVRWGLAMMTFEMAQDRPLFGVGFGHFRDHAREYARDPSSPAYEFASTAMEHNNFLSVLAETGITGLVLYVWLLLHLLWVSIRLYWDMPADALSGWGRDFILLYWVLFVDHITDAMFRETSVSPLDNCLFFAFSGVVAALAFMKLSSDSFRTRSVRHGESRQIGRTSDGPTSI